MQITMSPSTILRSCIHYYDSYIYTSTGVRVELFRFEMRSAQCEVVFPSSCFFCHRNWISHQVRDYLVSFVSDYVAIFEQCWTYW